MCASSTPPPGDECSAYLQYVHDEYEALPAAVVFLQYSSEHQLVQPSVVSVARLAFSAIARGMGYVALGRHSFEGLWPTPVTRPQNQEKLWDSSKTD